MKRARAALIGVVILTLFTAPPLLRGGSTGRETPGPQEEDMGEQDTKHIELATLGGGCFWCVEAVYERIEGVRSVISGYAGGTTVNPTYRQVCSGNTGHAEVVQIAYDARQVGFLELLELFWKAHDPTTLNRQGADVGTQYRSIILYHNDQQRRIAEQSKRELEASGVFSDPVITQIEPLDTFYPAEDYHQDYYAKNPTQGYCTVVIRPKLQKLGLEQR